MTSPHPTAPDLRAKIEALPRYDVKGNYIIRDATTPLRGRYVEVADVLAALDAADVRTPPQQEDDK